MRRTLSILLALAPVAVSTAGAQGASLRLAPQFASYKLTQGTNEVKVTEFAVPVAFAIPIGSRFNFDIATAFATATVDGTAGKSTISGLTDTQVRLNASLGETVVLTAGLNIPSGQYKVAPDKIAAASQIGNDFFAFPISSFGNGFGGTGGIAVAHSMGEWNFGLGASYRKSAEFGPFENGTTEVRFTPANEMRLRLGADHPFAGGKMMVGVVYSRFGDDACTGCVATPTTYSSGDRLIGQAGFDIPVGENSLYFGGWWLHHAEGQQVSGNAPPSNIQNGVVSYGFHVGGVFLEPSFEARFWQINEESAGKLYYGGLRTKFMAGSLDISPSIAYGTGTLDGTVSTDITGFKGGLTIRWAK